MCKRLYCLRRLAGAVAVLAAVGSRGAGAQAVTYTGALQGAAGDYGLGEQTTSVSFMNGLVVAAGRLQLSMSIPLVLQSSPWVTHSGAGPVPYGGPHRASTRDSTYAPDGHRRGGGLGGAGNLDSGNFDKVGLGDPMLFASVELAPAGAARPSVRATAAVKAPMGSVSQGFSTGEWDYGGGLALSAGVGRTMLFLDAMYWALGDMPGLELKDALSYSAALGTNVGARRIALLASLSGSTPVIAGTSAPAQIGIGVAYRWASLRSMNAGVAVGLTDSAPDLSVSLGWSVPLSR